MPEAVPRSPSLSSSLKQNLLWLAGGLLAVGVLSMTASYAPNVMKRLILFHAIYGIACGMVLLWLAAETHPRWQRSLPLWGMGLCLLGACNMGWLSYQHFQKARAEYAAAHPRDAALQAMLEKFSAADPILKERYEEEKRRSNPHFADFLAHRLSNLGDWRSPWPELFWMGEVLLAGVLCAGTMWLKSSYRRPSDETST